MAMTWDEFIDPTYHEDPPRRPMAELVDELRRNLGQPRMQLRKTYDNTKPREILRVYGGSY